MTDLHLYGQYAIVMSLENDKSTYCDASFSSDNRIEKIEASAANTSPGNVNQ